MTTAVFNPVAQQFYPADPIELTDLQAELIEAIESLEKIDLHPGWEGGNVASVAAELNRIQSVLDQGSYELLDLGYSYSVLYKEIRSHLEPIEITDVDPDGRVIVVGYQDPYFESESESEFDEF